MATEQQHAKQLHQKFETKYKNLHNKKLNTLQALHQMMGAKKSIKKIKVGLFSLGKSDKDIEHIKWNQKQHKEQFIKLCVQMQQFFEAERDQSMRSTEKNLSQMNQQIIRMRKSLSEKGIMLELGESKNKNTIKQSEQNKDRQEVVNNNIQKGKHHQNITHQQESSQNSLIKKIQIQNQQHIESSNNQQIQSSMKESQLYKQKNEQQSLAKDQNQQQNNYQRQQISKNQHYEQQFENNNRKGDQINTENQDKNQYQSMKTYNNGQITVQEADKRVSHQKPQNINIMRNNHQAHKKHQDIHVQKSTSKNSDKQLHQIQIQQSNDSILQRMMKAKKVQNNQMQWQQIPSPKKITKDSIQIENTSKSLHSDKKLDTLPQQLDNQFYEQQQKNFISQSQIKKHPKYNPLLEIKKKLNKNKVQLPKPRNDLEVLYYRCVQKLKILFAYYVRELNTKSFTFDGFPHSLDLKTFSIYYKHFKLGQLCKISQISKQFKKYAQNGAWLKQQGFIHIHSMALGLSDDVPKQALELTEQKQRTQAKYLQESLYIKQSNLSDKQKIAKQKQITRKKDEINKKYLEYEQKLQKLDQLLIQQQIRKLTRKSDKRSSPSSQNLLTNPSNIDPQKLKKIVQAHSGIYKQDIIQKLNDRKRQKQKRHELQMQKILQKYKQQQQVSSQSNSNSRSSFNKSNNQSTPHLHKIQGYAKRNKIKKHGLDSPQKIQDLLAMSRPNSDSKFKKMENKQYFVTKQTNQESKDVQNIQNNKLNAKKPEVYRQLSLPKLPKRQMRQQSIYQTLKLVDTKSEMEFIKNLLNQSKLNTSKEEQKIFNQFFTKEKQLLDKQKVKKSPPLQNRMKFT